MPVAGLFLPHQRQRELAERERRVSREYPSVAGLDAQRGENALPLNNHRSISSRCCGDLSFAVVIIAGASDAFLFAASSDFCSGIACRAVTALTFCLAIVFVRQFVVRLERQHRAPTVHDFLRRTTRITGVSQLSTTDVELRAQLPALTIGGEVRLTGSRVHRRDPHLLEFLPEHFGLHLSGGDVRRVVSAGRFGAGDRFRADHPPAHAALVVHRQVFPHTATEIVRRFTGLESLLEISGDPAEHIVRCVHHAVEHIAQVRGPPLLVRRQRVQRFRRDHAGRERDTRRLQQRIHAFIRHLFDAGDERVFENLLPLRLGHHDRLSVRRHFADRCGQCRHDRVHRDRCPLPVAVHRVIAQLRFPDENAHRVVLAYAHQFTTARRSWSLISICVSDLRPVSARVA